MRHLFIHPAAIFVILSSLNGCRSRPNAVSGVVAQYPEESSDIMFSGEGNLYLGDPASILDMDLEASGATIQRPSRSPAAIRNFLVFEKLDGNSRDELKPFVEEIEGKEYYVLIHEEEHSLALGGLSSIFEPKVSPKVSKETYKAVDGSDLPQVGKVVYPHVFSLKRMNLPDKKAPKPSGLDDEPVLEFTDVTIKEKIAIRVSNVRKNYLTKITARRNIGASRVKAGHGDSHLLRELDIGNASNREIAEIFRKKRNDIDMMDTESIERLNSLAAGSPRYWTLSNDLLEGSQARMKSALGNRIASSPDLSAFKDGASITRFAADNQRISSLKDLFDDMTLAYSTTKPFQMQKNQLGDGFRARFQSSIPNEAWDNKLLEIYVQARQSGKVGKDLKDSVAASYVEVKRPGFKSLSADSAELQKNVRAFLDREEMPLEEYAKINNYIYGSVNSFEETARSLIKSDKISNEELVLLTYIYAKDDWMYGKISESAVKRSGYDALSREFEKTLR